MSNHLRVISDLHFGHKNMAVKRGFISEREHDQHIVRTWNHHVGKKDTIYVLGDITMEKNNYEILEKLSGDIVIVGGNHDRFQHSKQLMKHVKGISGCIQKKGCIFTHIPIHESQFERYLFNIHGHVHTNSLENTKYINVSAEVVNYIPQIVNELINNQRKINKID